MVWLSALGAFYDDDVSIDFINRGCACIGHSLKAAPPAHAILRQLRSGDIIFIKSFSPNKGLTIKAVGLVKDGVPRKYGVLGIGIPVRWTWKGEDKIGKLNDKWPVRSVTIYEEHHPKVQTRIMDLLLTR